MSVQCAAHAVRALAAFQSPPSSRRRASHASIAPCRPSRAVAPLRAADSSPPAAPASSSGAASDKPVVPDDEFTLAKVSFGVIGLGIGGSLLSYGFGAYFNLLPGSEWSALMLTYGFPLTIIGMALKYAELKPVPCITYADAFALREKCATPILKQDQQLRSRQSIKQKKKQKNAAEQAVELSATATPEEPGRPPAEPPPRLAPNSTARAPPEKKAPGRRHPRRRKLPTHVEDRRNRPPQATEPKLDERARPWRLLSATTPLPTNPAQSTKPACRSPRRRRALTSPPPLATTAGQRRKKHAEVEHGVEGIHPHATTAGRRSLDTTPKVDEEHRDPSPDADAHQQPPSRNMGTAASETSPPEANSCTGSTSSRRRRSSRRRADEDQAQNPPHGSRRRTNLHAWTRSSQIHHRPPQSKPPAVDPKQYYSPPPSPSPPAGTLSYLA